MMCARRTLDYLRGNKHEVGGSIQHFEETTKSSQCHLVHPASPQFSLSTGKRVKTHAHELEHEGNLLIIDARFRASQGRETPIPK